MSTIDGFRILALAYPQTTHYLYARPHASSRTAVDLPHGRTLFLVNVPPDATERELVLLFKHCGTVERISFQADHGQPTAPDDDESSTEQEDSEPDAPESQPRKKRKLDKQPPPAVVPLPTHELRTLRPTGRSAHVVFLDASSLDRALAPASFPTSKPRPWPAAHSTAPAGLAHYAARYDAQRPPLDAVQAHADTYMERFEYDREKQRVAARSHYRKGEAVVDEDGFTLVTRGGAYGQTVGGGVAVASKRFQDAVGGKKGEAPEKRGRGRKKKEGKEKEGFYAFQLHEKKRKELLDLKKNWEADKAKIEQLKVSRKFKPY